MLVNIIQNTISSFRSALAAAEVITTNLKMWLGFETSETLGREEVVNGDFATDSDWTKENGWSIANGLATRTNVGSYTALQQNVLESGKTYQVTFTIDSVTSGEIFGIRLGTNYILSNKSTEETFTGVGVANATTLSIMGNPTFAGSISNISVKELTQITPDKSGNNNVGELFTGKAIEFDGVNDNVDIDGFTLNSSSTTIAFTIKSSQTAFAYLLDANPLRFNIRLNESGNLAIHYNGVSKSFGTTPNDGSFHRVVMVIDGANVNAYIDGVESGSSQTFSSSIDLSSFTEFKIGASYSAGCCFFDGILSDVQFYNETWSTDDIAYDYANPNKLAIDNPSTSLSVTNLKGYWAMSEGAGSLAYNSAVALGNDVVTDGDFPLPNVNWTLVNGAQITVNGLKIDNTVSGNFVGVKQFLTNNPFGKTFVATYDVIATNGAELAIQQTSDVTLDTTTIGTNKKTTFTWNRTIDELTIKRLGTGVNVTIDNFSLQEISVGYINGATYELTQPRIQQLGMMNWAKSTPESEEVTLIPNPNNTSQDILGNAVRDRLNSFNLDGSGYAEVADDDSLDMSSGFSTSFWIKLDEGSTTTDYDFLVCKGRGISGFNATYGFGTTYYNNLLIATIYTSADKNQLSFSNESPTGQWVFLCVTFEPNTTNGFKFYKIINNQTYIESMTTSGTVDESHNLNVGRDSSFVTTRQSKNIISDVLFYDSVLTSNQIENNYNAGLSAHTND